MNTTRLMLTITLCSVLCLMSTVIACKDKPESVQEDSEVSSDFTVGYLTLDSDVVKVSDTSIDSLNTNLDTGKSYYIDDKDDSSINFAIYYSSDSVYDYDSEESEYGFGCIPLESDLGETQQKIVEESTNDFLKSYLYRSSESGTTEDILYETDMTTYFVDNHDLIVHSCHKSTSNPDEDISLASFYLANREYQVVIPNGNIDDLNAVFESMHLTSDFDKDYEEAKKEFERNPEWVESGKSTLRILNAIYYKMHRVVQFIMGDSN